jgi:hypothetical protein
MSAGQSCSYNIEEKEEQSSESSVEAANDMIKSEIKVKIRKSKQLNCRETGWRA